MYNFFMRHSRLPFTHLVLSFVLASTLPISVAFSQNQAAVEAAARPVLTADAVQEAFIRVAEWIKPSVVTIYAERTARESTRGSTRAPEEKPRGDQDGGPAPDDDEPPFPFGPLDPGEPRTSLGTGMVIGETGEILTNYHVVKDSSVIRVIFNAEDERPARPAAKVIAYDEESDLAVLRLVSLSGLQPLRAVEFGDSDKVRIGEWALAVGAPFDQAQTVTVGVISAKGRHLDKDNRLSLQDYIQTDASINPGNSGGPLVNLDGKVIGINTAILSPSRFNVGIGFAVPSNTIRQYLPLLRTGKTIARGFLGIQYTALEPDVAREFGVVGGMQIGALARRGEQYIGPAREAGLQEGDIITHVNGQAIVSSDDFRRLVAGSTPGTRLKFTVVRPNESNGVAVNESRDILVTLGDWNTQNERKPAESTAVPPAVATSPLGLKVEDAEKLTSAEQDLFGLTNTSKGLVITSIAPGSPADDAQLRRGLRVARLRVNGGVWQTPANAHEFSRFENSLPPGARVLLQLRDRQNVSLYKVIVLAERR